MGPKKYPQFGRRIAEIDGQEKSWETEMEPSLFVKGLIVGLVMCAPVGPIGVLCVRRSLLEGLSSGLVSVLGASTVDLLYCSIAGFGITYISSFLKYEEVGLRIIGGLILILIGTRIFLLRPNERGPKTKGQGLIGAYVSSFLLMLANPLPILVFSAAFTALEVHGWKGDFASTATLVSGVFSGSALWSPILVALVSLFRPQFSTPHLRVVNRFSGAMIVGFGVMVEFLTMIG